MEPPKRMLGNVSLEIYGTTRKPEMVQALKNAVARSEKLTGKLYIGYPVGAEAVLISDEGQITVIDLSPAPPDEGYPARQDTGWNAVHRLLMLESSLTAGRNPKFRLNTVTIGAGIRQTQPDHPLVSVTGAMAKLEEFQQNPPEGVDPNTVEAALLSTHAPDWRETMHHTKATAPISAR